jgi:peptidoglycan/LPS O-acetylase OafA/YrhL
MSDPNASTGTPPAAPVNEHRHLAALDGLRAVAIGLVLVSHVTIYAPHAGWVRQLALGCAATGVTLFFVLSGYLITTLLLREERKHGAVDLRAFYVRRALRLLPAAYVYLVVIAALAVASVLVVPVHDLLASFFYVRNLVGRAHETAHLWSLAIEEQFYMGWPLLLVVLAPPRRLRIVIGLVIALVLWRIGLAAAGRLTPTAVYVRTDLRIDNLLLGCILALALFRRGGVPGAAWQRWWIGAVGLVSLVALGYVLEPVPLGGVVERTLVALGAVPLLAWVLANERSRGTWILRTSVAQWIGRMSYGIYLWQQLFLGPPNATLGVLRTPAIGLALAVAVAALSHHLVERPFLRLKDRWTADARDPVRSPPVEATAV